MKKHMLPFLTTLCTLLLLGWSVDSKAQYSGGSGTDLDPYLISNFADLDALSQNSGHWGAIFKQTADINASATEGIAYNGGEGFIPIGGDPVNSVPFSGEYRGQNKTISNLKILRPGTDFVGLFGYCEGSLHGIKLIDANITGGMYVGGIAGGDALTIENCSSSGTIQGSLFVGGIGGFIQASTNSYSTCNVTGDSYVGGFCGSSASTIDNCYSGGSVTGNDYVGGFFGSDNGLTVTHSYSLGSVTGSTVNKGGFGGPLEGGGSVQNCYWNTDVYASNNGVGLGRTTAQLKLAGTFLSDPDMIGGWDFSLTTNAWGYNANLNSGYPFLRFQGYKPNYIFLGTSTDAWATEGNWSETAIPGSSDTVVIAQLAMNTPVISTQVAPVLKLTVEPNGVLTIGTGGGLTVSAALTNNAGTTGLVVESDGSLKNGTTGVTGTVKRSITLDSKWHFLSCPISQGSMPAICDGNFAPLTADFNALNGATYDFFYWSESLEAGSLNWINLKKPDWSPNTVNFGTPPRFVSGKGYLVEYQPAFPGSPNKVFTGTLTTGSVSIPIAKSVSGNAHNLIGNPYPGYIDWKAAAGWNRTILDISGAGGYDFWIWNESAGNYGVYNSGSGGDAGTNGVSRYIPPTQGFFVKTNSAGTISMDNQVRAHSSQSWLKNENNVLKFNVVSDDNGFSDEALAEFGHAQASGSDKFPSFYPDAPGLTLPVSDKNYSIRFLTDVVSNPSIPVNFVAGVDGNYTLTVTGTEAFENATLKDLKTGAEINVKSQPVYQFSANISDDSNRFLLMFSALGVETIQAEANKIYVYNNTLYVTNPGISRVSLYSLTGSKLVENLTRNEALYQLPLSLTTGYYLVTVTDGKKAMSEKIFIK